MILLLDRIEIHAYTTLKSVKDSSMYQVSTPSVVQKISKDKEGACVSTFFISSKLSYSQRLKHWEPFVICLLASSAKDLEISGSANRAQFLESGLDWLCWLTGKS